MKIIITRTYDPRQVFGDASVVNSKTNAIIFSFKTLELPWLNNQRRFSCIPTGVYNTIRHVSPKFGPSFWLQNVTGRSEILIHHGNFAASKNPRTNLPDTLGCILPGKSFSDINKDGFRDITSSRATMTRLLTLLPNSFLTEIR